MSTDEASPAPRRRWPVFVFLVAGLACAALAGPRVVAYGLVAGDGEAAAVLADGGSLSQSALADARTRYARALRVHPSDGGLALALARLDLRAAATDPEALEVARAHLRQAAAQAPNDAFVWSQLAHTALERGAPVEEIAGYLRLSRLTGRFEASSMLLRVPVALAYWEALPEDRKADMARDMRRLAGEGKLLHQTLDLYLGLSYEGRAIFLDKAFASPRERRAFRVRVLQRTKQWRS